MAEQYDSIADKYISAKNAYVEEGSDFAREYILQHLKPAQGTLLDIGCGAGAEMALYEQMPSFSRVIGLDPSVQMIENAKKAIKHPENLFVAGYESIPLADTSVDVVVARFSLHYVKDLDVAYREIVRILKPSGWLIQVVDHPLADAVEGERFSKEGTNYVRINLYGSKVQIEFPQHNFSNYFSPYFLTIFDLMDLSEYTATDREYRDGPNTLAYVARKKAA